MADVSLHESVAMHSGLEESFGSDSDFDDPLLQRLAHPASRSSPLLGGVRRDRGEDAPQLAPGTRTPAFTIEAAIGEGGFGTVYRATTPDGRTVAVKVLKKPLSELSTTELAFQQNEIEALMHLRHPALVEMLDYGVLEDGRLYFTMELVEGVRLDEYLRSRRKLDALEAIRIVQKICEALAHCHSFGVLHLDLKPANIILTNPFVPRLKILDFGLAHLADAAVTGGEGLGAGTLLYLAPEVLARRAVCARTDLYSIGAILYGLLSGRPPFADRPPNEILPAKLTEDAPPLEELGPGVPRALLELVASLLAREVKERVPTAAGLANRLRELDLACLQAEVNDPVVQPSIEVGDDIPFVGRDSDLAALDQSFDAVRASRSGATLFLQGETGVGKTRLITEFLQRVRRRGPIAIGYARCRPVGSLVSHAPIREALSRLVHAIKGHAREERDRALELADQLSPEDRGILSRLVPEISPALDPVAAPPELTGDNLGRATVAFLSAVSSAIPMILVIEDIQWMDQETMNVVCEMTRRLSAARVLMLLSGQREACCECISGADLRTLRPLDESASDEFLRAVIGRCPSDLLSKLKRTNPVLASGNPLFVAQIISDLKLDGDLTRSTDGQWQLSARSLGACSPHRPRSTAGDDKIDRLDPDARRVLAVAALIGKQFRILDLALSVDVEMAVLQRTLAEANMIYLCRCGDQCAFVSEAIREELIATIEPEERTRIHRRLAQRAAETGASSEIRAHHLRAAGERSASAEAYFSAASQAASKYAYAEAARHLRRVLEMLGGAPASGRDAKLLKSAGHELARITWSLGQARDVLEHLERMQREAIDATPEEAAATETSLARVCYTLGDFSRAAEHARRCVELAERDRAINPQLHVAKNIIARTLAATGRFRDARTALERACADARGAGDIEELAHSLGVLGVSSAFTGDFTKARDLLAESDALAQLLGDPARLLAHDFHVAAVCEAEGRWIEGAEVSAKLLAAAEQRGPFGLYTYLGTMFAGRHQFHLGNFGRARVLTAKAIDLARELGVAQGLSWAHAFFGDIQFFEGEYLEAQASYRRGFECAEMSGDAYGSALNRIGLAHVEAMTNGALDRAIELAEAALGEAERAGNIAVLPNFAARYGDLLERFGDRAAAARIRTRYHVQS